jgi:lysophospholipase L1-like esterase
MKKCVKSILALVLALALLAALPVLAATDEAAAAADALNALGLFRGTGEGYELDRAPTRAEALVMLTRLLGREEEALAFEGDCPLSDVAGRWMAPYVAWAYAHGITKGVSDAAFDPDGIASANMYATFMLRALEYAEDLGHFRYKTAVYAAARLGIAPQEGYEEEFTRGDAVLMSYKALTAPCASGEGSLLSLLIGKGVIDAEAAAAAGLTVVPPGNWRSYTVCCAGDSLTFGLQCDDPDTQSYPAVMAGLVGREIYFKTENYGRSGATVDPKDDFFFANPYSSSPEYADSVQTEAELVLLMLGTNDAFWSPNRDVFEENFTALLQSYIDLPQAPRVIVVLPPHTFFEMMGTIYDDTLEELVVKEKAVAETLGLPVIDARSFNEGRPELFVDQIHFTVEGYALLAETICTQLCAILQD